MTGGGIDRRSFLLGAMGGAAAGLPRFVFGQSQPFGALAAGPYKRLVIANARVLPGHGGPATGRWHIVIEGNVIADMTPAQGTVAPAGDRVIDATGLYVMPGLIDMHTHVRTEPLPLPYVY